MTNHQNKAAYKFCSASLLDVPLIFDLMMEGSEANVFATRFRTGTGAAYLLWFILTGIFPLSWRFRRGKPPSAWRIIRFEDAPIGFLVTSVRTRGDLGSQLLFFSIKADCRNLGHGKAVLKQLVGLQACNSILTVSCTKYAVAMQHLLKREHFQRNRKGGFPLEQYSLLKQADGPATAGGDR